MSEWMAGALADLPGAEDDLIARTLAFARQQRYTPFTSTLDEAWRLSIQQLSLMLATTWHTHAGVPELSPSIDWSTDPVAGFGVTEARAHRARGIPLPMFLGLMKYYRQAYLDWASEWAAAHPEAVVHELLTYIIRCFDRVELGFIAEWNELSEHAHLTELQATNRDLTNEKNKYLTVFESLQAPAILLTPDGTPVNVNHSAAVLFGDARRDGDQHPGDYYYGARGVELSELPWLADAVARFDSGGRRGLTFDDKVSTNQGERQMEIRLEPMLDISEKYSGTVVLLNDVTARINATTALQMAQHQLETRVRQRTAALQAANSRLQQEVGRRRVAEEQMARYIEDRDRMLTTLYDVTSLVGAAPATPEVLQAALDRVVDSVGATSGTIHLAEGPGAWQPVAHLARHDRLPSAGDEPVGSTAHDPADQPTGSAWPLRAHDHLLGILTLSRAETEPFSLDEQQWLEAVADGLALAVENATRAGQAAATAEREQLARTLHDSATQSMYSLRLFVGWAQRLIDAGQYSEARSKLDDIGAIGQVALAELRVLMHELLTADSGSTDLADALRQRLAAVEERLGLRVTSVVELPAGCPASTRRELYRVAIEALNNIVRHAQASAVQIMVTGSDAALTLSIVDDGQGFDPGSVPSGGMGLSNMQTRVQRLGGELRIESGPGGTEVRALVPLPEREHVRV